MSQRNSFDTQDTVVAKVTDVAAESDVEENATDEKMGVRVDSHKDVTQGEVSKIRASTVDSELGDVPLRAVTMPIPFCRGHLHFNPVTSAIGLVVLFSLVIWCAVDPDGSKKILLEAKTNVSSNWTWFYIGTQGVWLIFILWIAYKYGHIRLGEPDEKPEYDDLSYFTMLFAAGVAVGLFFYGVSEPLWHSDVYHANKAWPNRFTGPGYHTMDEVDLYAMTITYFHWALAAWTPYLVVAIVAALGTYNFGLPLTMRSSVYPLLGELTWGWIGDLIDGFTIITVVSGVCTSLGLGAMQLVTGLRRMGILTKNVPEGDNTAEIIAIWVVTVVATMSVVSGLNFGIKLLSYIAFLLGSALWFLVLVLDKTSFLLNLMVEGVGSYFWWLPSMMFATDSFAQLTAGNGDAPRGGEDGWQNAWTVFYFAWWTAWSSFVGLFVARISKGRQLRSLIIFTLFGPFIYIMMWFSVFGGAGLRQARVASELRTIGKLLTNNTELFLAPGTTTCYIPPNEISLPDGKVWTYGMPGVSPVCRLDTNDADAAWFNVLGSYYVFGNFLSGLSLVAIAIYFVTSADSGSLVVDQLASNGRYDHHWIQRVMWATLEGAVATALIASGGSNALLALQSASVIAGLPFTLILCFACQSILHFCEHIDTVGRRLESAKSDSEMSHSVVVTQFHRSALFAKFPNKGFVVPLFGGIFNLIEYALSCGNIHRNLKEHTPMPSMQTLTGVIKGGVLPMWTVFEICCKLDPKNKSRWLSITLAVLVGALFVGWVACFAVPWGTEPGLRAFGWLFFFTNAGTIAYLRHAVRARFNITGNIFLDFFASLVLYPQVLCQLEMQFIQMEESENNSCMTRHFTSVETMVSSKLGSSLSA